MVDCMHSRITFLMSSLLELVWLFLNSTFLFRPSNYFYSTTHVGVFTPGVLTESLWSLLNFLDPVNDIGLLCNCKWLFTLLSSLSELMRLDSSSPNSPIFNSIVVKVFLICLFSLMMSDLLDFLDRLTLDLLSSLLLCYFFLPSFLLPYGQWDSGRPSLPHLKHYFVFQ